MLDKTLGVCVVGAGAMGTLHATLWNRTPHAQVVAVVDSQSDRAKKLAHECELTHSYADYRKAIEQANVDVVSICVPTYLHPEIAIFAAEHGKHVLCEKPIALTVKDADAMIAAAERNKIQLTVGLMRRQSPVHSDLRTWLASGDLGRPVMYHSVDVREIRPKREMHDAQANGGPIIDMGVHLFDAWSYIFDSRPTQVYAQAHKLAEGRPELSHIKELAFDTATVVVHYASGDTGTFVVSWGLPPGANPEGTPDQIFGPKGMATVQYHRALQELRVLQEGNQWHTVSISECDLYQSEIQAFADLLLGTPDGTLPATAQDGKAALQVALAALESIATGEVVNLSV